MLTRTNVINIGDPFIVTTDNAYYMYATCPDAEGFRVWKSEDLQTWENLGVCLDLSNSWTVRDYWAPEVIYHNGKYIMHFTARRKSDFSLRLGVAVSDSPEGPFVDAHNGPMFDLGYASIDGHVFIDDDGQPYFYFSKDCSENYVSPTLRVSQLCVCKLSDDLLNIISEPVVLFGPSESYDFIIRGGQAWNEGPYMLKKDGQYYMTYSANCFATRDYSICLAKAEHPMGPFQKLGPIMVSGAEGEDFSGPGHNAFFYDHAGKLKMTFHIHTHENAPSGDRKACICDAEICNGTIKFTL